MPIALSPAAQNLPKNDVEMMAGREPRVNICSRESQPSLERVVADDSESGTDCS
jgi:hypothetical protein